jgi:hypothetical protein
MLIRLRFGSLFAFLILGLSAHASATSLPSPIPRESIWALGNLFAWEAAPCDLKKRTSEERAQMLERSGQGFFGHAVAVNELHHAANFSVAA